MSTLTPGTKPTVSSNEHSYRSVKGVVANLVESLEDERDRLAREVERLTLHSTMQQHLIDKLAEQRPERDGPSNCAQEGHLWVTQCSYCGGNKPPGNETPAVETFLRARLGTIQMIAEGALSERSLPEIARLACEANTQKASE